MTTCHSSSLLRLTTLAVAGWIALTLQTAQADDVYRWQDGRGQSVYGDTPPIGMRAKIIEAIRPASAGTQQSAAQVETIQEPVPQPSTQRTNTATEPSANGNTRTSREPSSVQSNAKSSRGHPDCLRANAQLYVLENGARKRDQAASTLDEKARKAEIDRLRGFLQGCSN